MASPDSAGPDDSASPDDREYSPFEDAKPGPANMSSESFVDPQVASSSADQHTRADSNASASEDATPSKTPTSNGKLNPKDPLRPRRKKARRACFACQRAHLTCGDERPCQRCIKRGLQDACHDGVRKKAKYLHDAPPEALIPPGMGGYHHLSLNGTKSSPEPQKSGVPITTGSLAQASSYYAQAQPQTVDLYPPGGHHPQSLPPTLQTHGSGLSFGGGQPPISPAFAHGNGPQSASMNPMAHSIAAQAGHTMQQYEMFDPSDPAFFNLDITNLNFGNRYGALEFGMLDQMSSIAYDQAHAEMIGTNGLEHASNNFNPQFNDGQGPMFNQDALIHANWQGNNPRHNNAAGLLQTPNNTPVVPHMDRHDSQHLPQGFAIAAAGPGSFASASPGSDPQEFPLPLENRPTSPALFMNPSQAPSQHPSPVFTKPALPIHSHAQAVQPPDTPIPNSRKRPYDADYIYETVTSAYSYTTGFHRLLNFIQKRFPADKRIKIAKALAAVRPSLITWSQRLTNSDLIFMEVSVQRKTLEYLDFIGAYGTPTIIARRDGTVIAASKEFMILTGWAKNVLLGKEANMNVNTGGVSNSASAGSGLTSATRTRQHSAEIDRHELGNGHAQTPLSASFSKDSTGPPPSPASAPQPVVVPELLDQDSVVEFYEDYAKLAFGDSTGHACRRGKLLKYRTKEQMTALNTSLENDNKIKDEHAGDGNATASHERPHSNDGRIQNEAGINRLGEKEGMVDCMYIWSIRRDIFEVPMLIVMNFLPII